MYRDAHHALYERLPNSINDMTFVRSDLTLQNGEPFINRRGSKQKKKLLRMRTAATLLLLSTQYNNKKCFNNLFYHNIYTYTYEVHAYSPTTIPVWVYDVLLPVSLVLLAENWL